MPYLVNSERRLSSTFNMGRKGPHLGIAYEVVGGRQLLQPQGQSHSCCQPHHDLCTSCLSPTPSPVPTTCCLSLSPLFPHQHPFLPSPCPAASSAPCPSLLWCCQAPPLLQPGAWSPAPALPCSSSAELAPHNSRVKQLRGAMAGGQQPVPDCHPTFPLLPAPYCYPQLPVSYCLPHCLRRNSCHLTVSTPPGPYHFSPHCLPPCCLPQHLPHPLPASCHCLPHSSGGGDEFRTIL